MSAEAEARALLEEAKFGRATESDRTLRLANAIVEQAEQIAGLKEFISETTAWFDKTDPDERLTIYTSSNVTRGKASAAAVHAALMHYGIPHGAVIVLGASPSAIERECEIVVRDAGRTEVEPGTVTAGTATRTPAQ